MTTQDTPTIQRDNSEQKTRGKIMIIDIVIKTNNGTQLLLDKNTINLNIGEKEKHEEELKHLSTIIRFILY